MSDYHDWQGKLNQGKDYERILDDYFRAKDFVIESVGLTEDKTGIDRWFTSPKTGKRFSVQYKADEVATRTGNIVIETVSKDAPEVKRGWIYTTKAEYVAYFLPIEGVIYLCRHADMKARFDSTWSQKCPRGYAQNRSYATYFLKVPRADFISAVLHTFYLPNARAAQ